MTDNETVTPTGRNLSCSRCRTPFRNSADHFSWLIAAQNWAEFDRLTSDGLVCPNCLTAQEEAIVADAQAGLDYLIEHAGLGGANTLMLDYLSSMPAVTKGPDGTWIRQDEPAELAGSGIPRCGA